MLPREPRDRMARSVNCSGIFAAGIAFQGTHGLSPGETAQLFIMSSLRMTVFSRGQQLRDTAVQTARPPAMND
jgi:hypothetical protein